MPIIRTQDSSESSIGKALDIGAFGVQVPQVQNAEQALAVVKGQNSIPRVSGRLQVRQGRQVFHPERNRYFAEANEALVILQLEGLEALENIDAILMFLMSTSSS